MWIFQLMYLWPISVLSCIFQHPFPFHSICSPSSQLLLLRCIIHISWTPQIPTVLILSFAVVFHFASHSDSLIQNQGYSSALVILSKDSSPVAMIYLFPVFFFFVPSFLSLIFLLLLSQGSVAIPLTCLTFYPDIVASPWRNYFDHTDFSATNKFFPFSHFFLF